MPRASLVLLGVALAGAGPARAESCRTPAERPARRADAPCKTDDRLVPYDPTRVEAGHAPGSIRVSPDTEVRIGGRVQSEYGTRR